MAARIIAFPPRRPAKFPLSQHNTLFHAALAAFAEERTRSILQKRMPDESEILRLLRRIDRRLGRITAA